MLLNTDNLMTPSVISTYDICVYFQKGDIVILPDDHIKIILHKFFFKITTQFI
jgi:hypothetical protein